MFWGFFRSVPRGFRVFHYKPHVGRAPPESLPRAWDPGALGRAASWRHGGCGVSRNLAGLLRRRPQRPAEPGREGEVAVGRPQRKILLLLLTQTAAAWRGPRPGLSGAADTASPARERVGGPECASAEWGRTPVNLRAAQARQSTGLGEE